MRSRSTRLLAAPVAMVLVVAAAPVAMASLTATASLPDAVNGQVLDDDFAAGLAGFTLVGFDVAGNPATLVAYDVDAPDNGDLDDLSVGGRAIGESILVIEQEPGNEADNGTECGCIPDDAVGGAIQIRYNSPVHSWISNFVDVEDEERAESRLIFTDSGSGTSTTVSFDELIDPASPFYQGPAFVLGNALPQVMTNAITAAQLGHVFDVVHFDMAGSEALGTFTHVVGEVAVGSTVFSDADDDGVQDAGEPGIAGVPVELLDEAGAVVNTTTTDATGNYLFTTAADGGALMEGTYGLRVTPPDSHPTVSSTATPADDEVDGTNDATQATAGGPAVTGLFTVLLDDNPTGADESFQGGDQDDTFDIDGDMTIDVGLVPELEPAGLGDRVWLDTDRDGIQDAGEPGESGVAVNLWTDDDGDGLPDTQLASTTTDADGAYAFTGLDPRLTYVVQFGPARFGFTTANAGSDDAVDSDAELAVEAAPGTRITGPITLAPGQFDPTIDAGVLPPPMPPPAALGDLVWFDTDRDGVQDTDEPGVAGVTVELWAVEGDGLSPAPLRTTVTDGSGGYLFETLSPDLTYVVRFVARDGDEFTLRDADGDDAVDSDADPTTGITAPIDLEPGERDLTIDAGIVRDTPPAGLGDFVWDDADRDGIQDPGERAVSTSITVNLWTDDDGDGLPDTRLATTATAIDGSYRFDGLDPDLTYLVEFVMPEDIELTQQDAGTDDAVDSDADPMTGITGPIELEPGQFDPTIDAGVIEDDGGLDPEQGLGDYVWRDLDQDGIQDADEPVFPDVTVNLWVDDDDDGTPDRRVGTQVTDEDGLYFFPDLDADLTYVVEFIRPDGFLFTQRDALSDDALDSDPNPSTGLTGPIDLDEGVTDLTIDAGLYPEPVMGLATGHLLAIAALVLSVGAALLAPRRRRRPARG